MADYDKLGEAFSDLVNPNSQPGLLGYTLDDGVFRVVDPDDARKFFVRFPSGNFVSAYHKNRVLQKPNTPVLVGTDKQGNAVILGVDTSRGDAFFFGGTGGSDVGAHDHVRNSGREFIIDSWLIKRMRTTWLSGFTMQIDSGWYLFGKEIRYFTTDTIDLTSYIPSTTGYERWVIVGVDPVSETLVAVAGAEYFPTTLGDRSQISLIPFAQLGYIPIAAVYLTGDDTRLFNYRIEDLRFLPGGLLSYLEDLYNVSGAYNYYGYTLSYVNGVWRGMPGGSSGGGGVQSVVAGTNVTVDNTDPANPIVSASGGGGGGSELGYAEVTSGFSTNSSTFVDVTSMTVTVTVSSNPIKITLYFPYVGLLAGTNSRAHIQVVEGTTELGGAYIYTSTTVNSVSAAIIARIAPSAGSHTYKARVSVDNGGGGTIYLYADASTPMSILVEEL